MLNKRQIINSSKIYVQLNKDSYQINLEYCKKIKEKQIIKFQEMLRKKVLFISKTVVYTKETGTQTKKDMDTVFINGKMVLFIQDIGKIIRLVDMEN